MKLMAYQIIQFSLVSQTGFFLMEEVENPNYEVPDLHLHTILCSIWFNRKAPQNLRTELVNIRRAPLSKNIYLL
jgi:hypothetical protein